MSKWKYWDLYNSVTGVLNKKSFNERKILQIHITGQQLLTTRQMIEKHKEQHKKELKELYEWEKNIADMLRKYIEEGE